MRFPQPVEIIETTAKAMIAAAALCLTSAIEAEKLSN
jgi:hypothetical protein